MDSTFAENTSRLKPLNELSKFIITFFYLLVYPEFIFFNILSKLRCFNNL